MDQTIRRGLQLLCVWAALAGAVPAAAQPPAEYATPPVVTVPSLPADGAPAPSRPARPAARAPTYAPDAAIAFPRLSQAERDERHFLRMVSAIRRFQAEASQAALMQSNNPAVRTFATGVLQEQAASAIALQRLLHERGMATSMLDNPDRKMLNRLARLTGARFDREYLHLMSERLADAEIPLHERAVGWVEDPVLRSWIEQRLPTVRHRHAVAQRLTPPDRAVAQRPRPAASPARAATAARQAAPTSRMGAARQRPAPSRQRVE